MITFNLLKGVPNKGVSEADLLAQFANSSGVESLPLSYDEILNAK